MTVSIYMDSGRRGSTDAVDSAKIDQHSYSDMSGAGCKLKSTKACCSPDSKQQCGNAHYNCLFNYFSWMLHLHFTK